MKTFTFERATSPEEAVSAFAAQPHARYLAGGTNLVDLMKLGVETPEHLIDVSRLPLDEVEETQEGGLRVGANVRNSDLAAHPAVCRRYPALAEALLAGASGQLRNLATTGGNVLQRTRCPYFQDTSAPCNKREPGTGCSAREGVNRDMAVLGHSAHCVATHPSDMAVAMAAYDAELELLGPEGTRTVPAAEFHRLPGDTPEQDTVLRPGELISHVTLPAPPEGARAGYRKARDRASYAFALASAAAVLALDGDGRIRHAGLAFGGLAHRPWRARTAEEALLGARPDADSIGRALDAELAAARPLSENAFKVPLARSVAVSLLTRLAGTSGADNPTSPART